MRARVAIAGVPRAGKTTLAAQLAEERAVVALATDDLIGLGWSEASEEASRWFDRPGPLVVEGVAVPRALRKWLGRCDAGRPVDVLLWLGRPRQRLVPGQLAMGRGAATVLYALLPELLQRGVEVFES